MKTLALKDTQLLHHCIQQLYTLHDLDAFGVEALLIIDRLVPSDVPLFHNTNVRTSHVEHTFLKGFPDLNPELLKIKGKYLSEHPIAQRMPQTLAGAYKISDFLEPKELHKLDFLYQQFLRLLNTEDQMLLFLPNARPTSWAQLAQADVTINGFVLCRPKCNFTERDRLLLNILRPHLSQAHANARQYQELAQSCDRIQQSLNHLGVIIVDVEGKLQSITLQVSVWLEIYFGTSTCPARLPDNLWSWVKYQIASCADQTNPAKACLPLRIQQAGRELTIRLVIESLDERYLLMLEEQPQSAFNAIESLGLSQRETEVLACIIAGKNNKSIASQLSVSTSTVGKHLENIYLKLGVNSRTAAIAQALEKLGCFNSLAVRQPDSDLLIG